VQADEDNTDYMSSLAAAAARSGDTASAKEVLEKMQAMGTEQDRVKELQAELLYINKDYNQALVQLLDIAGSDLTEELQYRVLALMKEIYCESGDYKNGIAAFKSISPYSGNMDIYYLSLMNLYLYDGNSQGNKMLKEEDYRNAADAYEKIAEKEICSINDELNVAIVYQNISRFDKAVELLSGLAEKYPNNYKIYMQLSYCYYSQSKSSGGDYSKAKEYYNRAEGLYKAENKKDSEMTTLENIMSGLK
jgi:tetratricopeptide (TPR) repeat protein